MCLGLFRYLILFLVSAQLVAHPAYSAMPATAMKAAGDLREIIGFSSVSSSQYFSKPVQEALLKETPQGGLIVHLKNGTAVVIKAADTKTVQKFKPSTLLRTMPTTKEIVLRKIHEFPMEAFSFFVALGAVQLAQQVFSDNPNPVGFKNWGTSQGDLIGQISFMAFTIANGLTSEPLMAMTKSPKAARYISYLGMAVGMLASNIVSEVANSPNLLKCAFELAQNTSGVLPVLGVVRQMAAPKSCDLAFENWTEKSLEKTHEWAPGLMSMLASTAAAGKIEGAAASAGRKVGLGMASGVASALVATAENRAVQTLILDSVSMVFSVSHSRVAVSGAKFIGKIAKIGLFVELDHMMHSWFSFPYQNLLEGSSLRDMQQALTSSILAQKASGWTDRKENSCKSVGEKGCVPGFDVQILRFKEVAKRWRQVNMNEVIESQHNWQEFLRKLSTQYNAASDFHQRVVDEMSAAKDSREANLFRTYPLYGVTPFGIQESSGGDESHLVDPEGIEAMQIKTIQQALSKITKDQNFLRAQESSMDPSEVVILKKLFVGLSSPNRMTVGASLSYLNKLLNYPQTLGGPPPKPSEVVHISEAFQNILATLRTHLGEPLPIAEPGMGLLENILRAPSMKSLLSASHPRTMGRLQIPNITHYLTYQTFAGPRPDLGAGLIRRNGSGFPDQFIPPGLPFEPSLQIASFRETDPSGIYNLSIGDRPIREVGSTTVYKNYVEAYQKAKLPTNVMQDFRTWWEKYVEPQYLHAWDHYEKRYLVVVAQLARALRLQRSAFNIGPLENSVIDSLRQERKFYLMVIGEMFKDLYGKQHGSQISTYLGSTANAPRSSNSDPLKNVIQGRCSDPKFRSAISYEQCLNQDHSELIPLLQILHGSPSLELAQLVQPYRQPIASRYAGSVVGRNLKFQDDIEAAFNELETLLTSFEFRPAKDQPWYEALKFWIRDSSEVTLSNYKNSDFGTSANKALAIIDHARTLFGKKDTPDSNVKPPVQPVLQLSPGQQKILDAAFMGLKENVANLKDLGLIINSGSYRKQDATGGRYVPSCVGETRGGSSSQGLATPSSARQQQCATEGVAK